MQFAKNCNGVGYVSILFVCHFYVLIFCITGNVVFLMYL